MPYLDNIQSANNDIQNTEKGKDFEVLLIDPGIQLKTIYNVKYINRGLLSIATFLKSKGINVTYFPLDHYYLNEKMNTEQVLEEIEKIIREKDIKVSAISSMFTAETDNVLKIAKFIKDKFPENNTVIGGFNPTITNQELIEEKEIDYMIMGEGEWALYDLVSAIKNGEPTDEIRGLVSKESKGMKGRHGDLAEIPPADYSILPKGYLLSENPPCINMEINRGCPHHCTFCSVTQFWKETLRSHQPLKLIKEFQQLREIGYHGTISLEESMVNFKSQDVKEFLRKAVEFKNDFKFDFIATRYDFIDDESLELLDKIGFENLMMGLESSSKTVLDKINKHIDLDKYIEACKTIKKHKIDLNLYMIVGLPGETEETFEETYHFLSKLMKDKLIDSVFPCYFQPFRGTKAREDLLEIGGTIIAERNSDYLMRAKPLVEYPWLSSNVQEKMMGRLLDLNDKYSENREARPAILEKIK